MKWFVIVTAVLAAISFFAARRVRQAGRSADEKVASAYISIIGFAFLALSVLGLVLTGVWRLLFAG